MSDISFYIQEFRKLRDDWCEEVPDQMLHSAGNLKYKVRSSWFTRIIWLADQAAEYGLIEGESLEQYESFSAHVNETEFKNRRTTKEDIKKGNAFLDLLIADFEKQAQSQN
jgi:hypothetical protein